MNIRGMRDRMKKKNKYKERNYFRMNELIDYLGISRTTFWKIRKNLNFPKGKQISKQVTIWSKKEIDDWLTDREIKDDQ